MVQSNHSPLIVRVTTVPLSLHKLLKGQMRFMQEQGFSVHLVTAPGPEIDSIKNTEGTDVTIVKMSRNITPLRDFISLCQLFVVFWRLKPDIVHTHTPKAGLLGMIAARLAGVPIRLHTVAGLPWMEAHGFKKKLLKHMEKLTVYFSTRVYVNSLKMLNFMRINKIDASAEKLRMIGNGSSNGIDIEHFNRSQINTLQTTGLKRISKHSNDGFIWLFVGRMVGDKGIAELIQAFLHIKESNPSDQLWLVGPAEQNDSLPQQLYSSIEQDANIVWWGYQDDVRPFFAAADTLVFPSYREGFPNVPMQAAAMECPMILSDINGCNEIVQNNVNGILVPVKNAGALTDAMLLMRTNQEIREKFKERSLQIVKEKFSNKTFWKLMEQEYRNLLSSKKDRI